MHVLLAIDATLRSPSCLLRIGDAEQPLRTGDRAVEELSLLVRGALREAGISMGDVDDIAVGAGPGSYTGVRAAVASANALAFACGIPVSAIVSPDAAAVLVVDLPAFIVATPAGRGRSFVTSYRRGAAGRLVRERTPSLAADARPPDGDDVPWVSAIDPRSDQSGQSREEVGGPVIALSALGVARTFDGEPQLVVEPRAVHAATILPPPTIGGRR